MDIVEEMNKAVKQCHREVKNFCEAIGQETEEYVKENANFRDVTGNLRKSYYHKVLDDGLVIGNSADYASNVEARGKEVLSFATEFIKHKL